MAAVTLSIGGRSYTLACRDGGEAHLSGLATRVDAKVAEARAAVGTTNEVRQLLFAALLLADEAGDAAARPTAEAATYAAATVDDDDTERALDALAARVERIADALEREATTP